MGNFFVPGERLESRKCFFQQKKALRRGRRNFRVTTRKLSVTKSLPFFNLGWDPNK